MTGRIRILLKLQFVHLSIFFGQFQVDQDSPGMKHMSVAMGQNLWVPFEGS